MSKAETAAAANSGQRILVASIGGGAGRILQRLRPGVDPLLIDMVCLDSDARALETLGMDDNVRLGVSMLKGLGCGGDPSLGKSVAEADRRKLGDLFKGYDLVVLIGCLGGGFASGAMPVAAAVLAEQGVTCLAFCTLPFSLEGERPMRQAREALQRIRESTQALVELPNTQILTQSGIDDRIDRLFAASDDWIRRGVQAVTGLLTRPGLMPLDLAKLRRGIGERGSRTVFSLTAHPVSDTPETVVEGIFRCPLMPIMEREQVRCDRLLLSLGVGPDGRVVEVARLLDALKQRFHCDESVAVGLWIRDDLAGKMEVALFASTDLGRARSSAPMAEVSRPVVHQSRLKKKKGAAPAPAESGQQVEFDYIAANDDRGVFAGLPQEPYDGRDLDRPTFLRRSIRIKV